MDSNEPGKKKKKSGPKSDFSLLLHTPEDSGCVFGDLIRSEPLCFETEMEEELKAAEVHVDSCAQTQLLPRQILEVEKGCFPEACGGDHAGWHSETPEDPGSSGGNTLPSSLR